MTIKILFHRDEIANTVAKLAAEINMDYQGKHSLLLGVLKGSFVFMADLIRLLNFPLEVEFIRLSSYGQGRTIPGNLEIVQGLCAEIRGRDVLVIEDIVDSGLTVTFLLNYLWRRSPNSLKLCALMDKPSRHQVPVAIDYLGFMMPDKFVVGYGLDWNEKFRNLPYIGYVE